MLLPALLFLIALLSGLIAIWAWRGKYISDHSICRKCRYDLYGTPAALICPECGAALNRTHAIRVGIRKRRTAWLVAAACTGLATFASGSYTTWTTLGQPSTQHHLPVWVLRWETTIPSPLSRLAVKELVQRLKAGSLTRAQIDSVVNDALTVQQDRQRTWNPTWGTFIEIAQRQNRLTKKDWNQYLHTLTDLLFHIRFRKRIRQGDPWPWRLDIANPRCSRNAGYRLDISFSAVTVDGHRKTFAHPIPIDSSLYLYAVKPSQPGWPAWDGNGISWLGYISLPKLSSPGPKRIDMIAHLKLKFLHGSTNINVDLHSRTTVVPATKTTIKAVYDRSKQKAMRKAIVINGLFMDPATSVWQHADGLVLQGVLWVHSPPVSSAFHAVARDATGRTWPLSISGVPAGAVGDRIFHTRPLKDFHARYVDIILTPSENTAIHSVDVYHYWSKPIVFKHLKIDWSGIPRALRLKSPHAKIQQNKQRRSAQTAP